MYRLLYAVAICLCAVPVFAQTNPVPAGQPFNVGWTHDGLNVVSFTCAVDGKPLTPALPATARQCAIPGQTAGTHTITVSATNTFGSAASGPLTATAGSPPSAPTNLQIVVQVAIQPDGSVTMLAANVERK